jgi:biotin carboxyl carrier protein|tara:strand:+ start:216 stop:434 length:219 start_codon:yes stop_codon:yes gene_type:complete
MATEVKTTVPGNMWKVLVKEGDTVKKGDNLFIMEVMKTEVHHDSPVDGTVIKVNVVNDQEGIDPGTVAIIIE